MMQGFHSWSGSKGIALHSTRLTPTVGIGVEAPQPCRVRAVPITIAKRVSSARVSPRLRYTFTQLIECQGKAELVLARRHSPVRRRRRRRRHGGNGRALPPAPPLHRA